MPKNIKWTIAWGIVIWVVGFAVGIVVFAVGADQGWIRRIMMVLSPIMGILFCIHVFRQVPGPYLLEGLKVGIAWYIINLLLDTVITIPMSGMGLGKGLAYFGAVYLIMPVVTVVLGLIFDHTPLRSLVES